MPRQQANATCRVCGGSDIDVFIEIESVPVFCNVLLGSIDTALNVPRGSLSLGFCTRCGHIYNHDFDPGVLSYSTDYENSLFYSNNFKAYATGLAKSLVDRYHIKNRKVVEIACGKGDFLKLLCDLGDNRGLGFDPSFDPQRADFIVDDRIRFIKDYFSEAYKETEADLICCRHALEHIPDPSDFVKNLRNVVSDRKRVILFFEVPNALYTLRDQGIWDLLYEHCSYFTPSSLRWAFQSAGFTVLDLRSEFDDQFLCIEAEASLKAELAPWNQVDEIEDLDRYVRQFEAAYGRKVREWQEKIARWQADGLRVALWGGGTKGVTFSNALKLGDAIPYIVDINPHKHHRFAPGTGQLIVPPDFLTSYRPDRIVIMNGIYQTEIRDTLSKMGLHPEIDIA
ncbi:MAG: methyltransferase domain-containing protein [Desulfobacteraceae bacterium]|nr:methyltransferase domain-containing protein [Desulfobacteraceae bacterium]